MFRAPITLSSGTATPMALPFFTFFSEAIFIV